MTYGFDPLSKHLFVKFTNSHEPGGHLFFECLFVHLHWQHCTDHLPPRVAPRAAPRAALPVGQKSAPKSGPAHCPYAFTPVKVPRRKNSEQSRQARCKCILKYLLRGAGSSAEQDIIKSQYHHSLSSPNWALAHTLKKMSWMSVWNRATCWQPTIALYTGLSYLPITCPQGVPEIWPRWLYPATLLLLKGTYFPSPSQFIPDTLE